MFAGDVLCNSVCQLKRWLLYYSHSYYYLTVK